jgi:hypothetical protein
VRTHAHESWHPRAAAWPCRARGTGISGPRHDAAAKGRRRLAVWMSGAIGSYTRAAQSRMGEWGILRLAKEVSSAAHGSRWQQGIEGAVVALTGGLAGEGLARWQAGAGGSGLCRVRGCVDVVVRAQARWRCSGVAASSPSSRCSFSSSPLLFSSFGVATAERGKAAGRLGFAAAAGAPYTLR